MSDTMFYSHPNPMTIEEVAGFCGGEIANLSDAINGTAKIKDVAPIDEAGEGHLAFVDNPRYVPILSKTKASAVLIAKKYLERVPNDVAAIVVLEPYKAYAAILAKFYPQSMRPLTILGQSGISPAAHIGDNVTLEDNVTIEAGAVIGEGAEIGSGSVICANAVVGSHVKIGRNSTIGAGASVQHALIGNEVILHNGVAIGQDGFGFAMGFGGHLKVPQIGRVIIQDKVEIGANSCVDRGANRDTIIGEGTKIDNMVQIGHNVVVGCHCVLVSKVAIAGSTTLGDYVAIGGHTAVAGHLKIGDGAQIAASSGVANDVPAGARWGGTPARYAKHWLREVAQMRSEARKMENKANKK